MGQIHCCPPNMTRAVHPECFLRAGEAACSLSKPQKDFWGSKNCHFLVVVVVVLFHFLLRGTHGVNTTPVNGLQFRAQTLLCLPVQMQTLNAGRMRWGLGNTSSTESGTIEHVPNMPLMFSDESQQTNWAKFILCLGLYGNPQTSNRFVHPQYRELHPRSFRFHTCLFLQFHGTGKGRWRGEEATLQTYFWAFMPSIACIILSFSSSSNFFFWDLVLWRTKEQAS